MSNNIGWHIRCFQTGDKLQGGSFGGDVDMSTADRLVKSFLIVETDAAGNPYFIDKKTGKRVWLYISIDARKTEAGKAAIAEYDKKQAQLRNEQAQLTSKLENLLCEYDAATILAALKKSGIE